jgi:hypothetical protein
MVSEACARRLALALPDAVEQDHHGFPSFRVNGRIFATLPSPERLRAMSDEHSIRAAAAAYPRSCREYFWGKRLACVEIQLDRASIELVRELLAEAWDHKR